MSFDLTPLAVQHRDTLEAIDAMTARDTAASLADQLDKDRSNFAKSLRSLEAEGLIGRTGLAHGPAFELTAQGRRAQRAMRLVETGRLSGGPPPLAHAQIRPDPNNPRQHFDEDELAALAESIAARGLMTSVLVRLDPDGDGATLVAGERRWRAIGQLIAAEDPRWPADRPVPYLVREEGEAGEILIDALIENVQRVDLHPLDEARAFARLKDEAGLGAPQIAERLGNRTRRYVEQRLDLLNLTEAQQERMRLPADDPQHLSTTGARDMLQHLRRIASGTAEQRDIEEIAPTAPELPSDLPDDAGPQLAKARQAQADYDAAMRARDNQAAVKAAEAYDEVATWMNGGREYGRGGLDRLNDELAAPDGEVPGWGQAGLFLLVVDGMKVVVKARADLGKYSPSGSADFHVYDPTAPFLSDTGYRSELGLRGPGSFLDAVIRAIARAQTVDSYSGKRVKPGLIRAGATVRKWAALPEIIADPDVVQAAIDAVDPLVVKGVRFPSLARANEARRLAAGGGPANSGSTSRPTPPPADAFADQVRQAVAETEADDVDVDEEEARAAEILAQVLAKTGTGLFSPHGPFDSLAFRDLLEAAGMRGPFHVRHADGDGGVWGGRGEDETEFATVDVHRELPDALSLARCELIAFALNAVAGFSTLKDV